MRLGLKFAIAFFISSIASISFISVLSYTLARNALQRTIVSQQEGLTQQTVDTIDRIINQRLSAVYALAQNDAVISFAQNNNGAPVQVPELMNKVKDTIQALVPITGTWEDMDIVSPTGTVLYSQFPQTIGKQLDTPILKHQLIQALQGHIAYSDVLKDPESNKESIIFGAPIVDKTNPVHPIIGVLFGHGGWEDVLSALRMVNANTVELYNAQGLLIGDNQRNSSIAPYLAKTSFSPTIIRFRQEAQAHTFITTDELISVVSEKGTGTYTGNKWFLAIRTPAKIAFAPAINSAIIIAGLLLPVIIVVNAILLIFILELLRPILLIGQAAEDIAKGNLTKRVPHTGNDEIGWLADSFNKMADTLQELYEGLEKKVQEKTKELSEKMEDAESMNSFMIKRELKLIELKKQIADLKQQLEEKKS